MILERAKRLYRLACALRVDGDAIVPIGDISLGGNEDLFGELCIDKNSLFVPKAEGRNAEYLKISSPGAPGHLIQTIAQNAGVRRDFRIGNLKLSRTGEITPVIPRPEGALRYPQVLTTDQAKRLRMNAGTAARFNRYSINWLKRDNRYGGVWFAQAGDYLDFNDTGGTLLFKIAAIVIDRQAAADAPSVTFALDREVSDEILRGLWIDFVSGNSAATFRGPGYFDNAIVDSASRQGRDIFGQNYFTNFFPQNLYLFEFRPADMTAIAAFVAAQANATQMFLQTGYFKESAAHPSEVRFDESQTYVWPYSNITTARFVLHGAGGGGGGGGGGAAVGGPGGSEGKDGSSGGETSVTHNNISERAPGGEGGEGGGPGSPGTSFGRGGDGRDGANGNGGQADPRGGSGGSGGPGRSGYTTVGAPIFTSGGNGGRGGDGGNGFLREITFRNLSHGDHIVISIGAGGLAGITQGGVATPGEKGFVLMYPNA